MEGKLPASLGRNAPRECEGVSGRMGGAKRYPSMPARRGDGYRFAPPILRTSLAMTASRTRAALGSQRLAQKPRSFQSVAPRQIDRFCNSDPYAGDDVGFAGPHMQREWRLIQRQ